MVTNAESFLSDYNNGSIQLSAVKQYFDANPYIGCEVLEKAVARHTPNYKEAFLFIAILKQSVYDCVNSANPDMFELNHIPDNPTPQEYDNMVESDPWKFFASQAFDDWCVQCFLCPNFVIECVKFDVEVSRLYF